MAELSAFLFFSITGYIIGTTKIQMHVLACSKSITRKQMVSLDFWAQTAYDRHLFYCFWSHLKFDLFYLTLTWPSVKSAKNALGQPNGYHNRIMWPKWTRTLSVTWPIYYLKNSVTSCDLALTSNIPCTCLILLEYVQYEFKSCDQIWARSDLFSHRQSPKCKHAPYVNNFDFDLTFDISDLEVNKIRFRSTVLAGLSNTVWIWKIGPVASEIGGGSKSALNSPPSLLSQSRHGIYPSQARVKGNCSPSQHVISSEIAVL